MFSQQATLPPEGFATKAQGTKFLLCLSCFFVAELAPVTTSTVETRRVLH